MQSQLRGLSAALIYFVALLILAFILAPLIAPVIIAFSDGIIVAFPPQRFSLRWFTKVLADEEFLAALAFSARLAAAVTVLALALGLPCAFGLARRRFPGRDAMMALIMAPLIFPVLVTGLALLQFFTALGSRNTFLHLVIGHTVIAIPYVVRTAAASIVLVDEAIEDAARTLGATRLCTFLFITLPQIRQGIIAGAVFSFVTSFDDYSLSMWLADAANFPLPLQIHVFIQRFFDPSVAAISTLMILFSMMLMLLIERGMGLSVKRLVTT